MVDLKSIIVNILRARPFPKGRVGIGEYTIGTPYIFSRDKNQKIIIGKFCLFGPDVMLIVGNYNSPLRCSGHEKIANYYLTRLGNGTVNKEQLIVPSSTIQAAPCTGYITIGNDVWVGARAIILSNVTIGDGAVIGAGAVVSHDVPPYAVVAGIPARIIRIKFSKTQVEKLLQIAWWNWPKDKIVTNMNFLTGDLDALIKKFAE